MNPQNPCPDCDSSISRRQFVSTVGTTAAVASILPGAYAAPTAKSTAETAVARLYNSLSEKQLLTICFPFKHRLRQRVSANWHITKPTIGDDFYTDKQRKMMDDIVRGLASEDGYKRLVEQMEDDAGGLDFYSAAIFGEPGKGKFEWVLTGRHLTLRADGNSVDKAAFGGPIVYGHAEENPKQNLYHYQTKKTNEVFKALDAKQAKKALLRRAPRENNVRIQGEKGTFPGLAVSEMSKDQQKLVESTLKTLLAPHREEDAKEVMAILKKSGGLEKLHMAFYQQGDLASDKVWDIWRVEGPSFVWHFRGAPHVHAYINIGMVAPAENNNARPNRRRR